MPSLMRISVKCWECSEMKSVNVKLESPTYSMLEELVKKHSMKNNEVFVSLIISAYNQMKRSGRRVL